MQLKKQQTVKKLHFKDIAEKKGDGVVRTVKDAIILAMLREEARSSRDLAETLGLEKSHITKSLTDMKKTGLVAGWGTYEITEKGKMRVELVRERINGK